jgi:hypothetical protein
MHQPDDACVQRWFAEVTGFETCNDCKGLIVEPGSSKSSAHSLQSPSSNRSLSSLPSETAKLQEKLEKPYDHTNKTANIVAPCHKCLLSQIPEDDTTVPYKEEASYCKTNATMSRSGLRGFYPGFIQPAPGPCRACRRKQGPHPTRCPGCNHQYMLRLAENPPRPEGYIGNRPPFGLAGWRVARGHRRIYKPVTLHNYGCYMQRKKECYGGEHADNFVHLGQPPSLLVNFKGCPR